MTAVVCEAYTPSNKSLEVCPVSTFYHGDCLFVMRHDIPPESIDLIYLDPPFFTGKVQKGEWRPEAMEISFDDSKRFWAEKQDVMRDKAPMWLRHLALKRPDFASYLFYMMERLEACRRVLKHTGSIYLHCDWRASHYLRMVMDEVFGHGGLINEIIWGYRSGGTSKRTFARKHDTILAYAKSQSYKFNPQTYKSWQRKQYRYNPKYPEYFDEDEQRWYHLAVCRDVWEDIPAIGPDNRERVGYPTQKPEALLERIIDASSDEGDTVLDPFCGCGTTVIAASKRNREWIGIDIDVSPREKGKLPTAFTVISNRSYALFDQADYITRDISEVKEMDGYTFERWANEILKATKPQPDKGVDGITQDGIPIQAKVYEIKYNVLSEFITNAKLHPLVPKPVKKIIAISQTGFDDSARQRKFEIETTEGIEVELVTAEDVLGLEG